jgi:putative hydrolase of the HAD superfamily
MMNDNRTLADLDTWVFDLDNTLYPAATRLFDQVDRRIGEFVSRELGLKADEARLVQKSYFREHGTTLRGMMLNHATDPHHFMDYVHDIDLSQIMTDSELDGALNALPGRKIIYTNASASHAERVMERLGISRHFSGIFDIIEAQYVPKPALAGYTTVIERFGFAPGKAAMVEDMARNLLPAKQLGMTTLWVRTDDSHAQPEEGDTHIDHVTDNLASWLKAVL